MKITRMKIKQQYKKTAKKNIETTKLVGSCMCSDDSVVWNLKSNLGVIYELTKQATADGKSNY